MPAGRAGKESRQAGIQTEIDRVEERGKRERQR